MKTIDENDFFDWCFADEILAMTGEPVVTMGSKLL